MRKIAFISLPTLFFPSTSFTLSLLLFLSSYIYFDILVAITTANQQKKLKNKLYERK